MAKVTKESLERKISTLECDERTWGELSLNAEYQLEAYKMLLERIEKESFVDDFMSKMRGPL